MEKSVQLGPTAIRQSRGCVVILPRQEEGTSGLLNDRECSNMPHSLQTRAALVSL